MTNTAHAQSLIVGTPSASVTDVGRTALTHESQFGVFRSPLKWNSFFFITHGIARDLEIGLTLYGLSDPRSNNLAIGAGYKKIFRLWKDTAPDWQLRVVIGQFAVPSLERKEIGGWVFGLGSLRLPAVRTRLTGGLSYGSQQVFGFQADGRPNVPVAAMVGIEQPITRWLTLVADWVSGTHDLAALIGGVQVTWNYQSFIMGLKMPNNKASGDPAVIFEIMLQTL